MCAPLTNNNKKPDTNTTHTRAYMKRFTTHTQVIPRASSSSSSSSPSSSFVATVCLQLYVRTSCFDTTTQQPTQVCKRHSRRMNETRVLLVLLWCSSGWWCSGSNGRVQRSYDLLTTECMYTQLTTVIMSFSVVSFCVSAPRVEPRKWAQI